MSHVLRRTLTGLAVGVSVAFAAGVTAAFTPPATAYATGGGGHHDPHPPKAQLSGSARCAVGGWVARFELSNPSNGTVQVVGVRRESIPADTPTTLTAPLPLTVAPGKMIFTEISAPLSVTAIHLEVDYRWTLGVPPGIPKPQAAKTGQHPSGGHTYTLSKTVHRCDCPTPPSEGGPSSPPPGGGPSNPPSDGESTPPSDMPTTPTGAPSTPPDNPGGGDNPGDGGSSGGGAGQAAGEQLPLTGSPAANAALIGGVLLLGGAAAVIITRRNRRRFEA